MKKNNYPQGALDEIEPAAVNKIVGSLRELYDKGRPKTDEEVEQRIDSFFAFCENSSIRPGIESLCLALHISRQTLLRWKAGDSCTERRQEAIEAAKSFIGAYIEQAVLGGKISPPSGIFLMKNWLGYKDSISIEEATPVKCGSRPLSADQLPQLGQDLSPIEEHDYCF